MTVMQDKATVTDRLRRALMAFQAAQALLLGVHRKAKALAWIIHDECRPKRKPLISLSEAAEAEFVEFCATKSSARPFPWR